MFQDPISHPKLQKVHYDFFEENLANYPLFPELEKESETTIKIGRVYIDNILEESSSEDSSFSSDDIDVIPLSFRGEDGDILLPSIMAQKSVNQTFTFAPIILKSEKNKKQMQFHKVEITQFPQLEEIQKAIEGRGWLNQGTIFKILGNKGTPSDAYYYLTRFADQGQLLRKRCKDAIYYQYKSDPEVTIASAASAVKTFAMPIINMNGKRSRHVSDEPETSKPRKVARTEDTK